MSDALAALQGLLEIDGLARPGWLPWLLLAAVMPLILGFTRQRPALAWPAIAEARRAGARRFELTPALGRGLRTGALLCLASVLAGPLALRALPPESALGLDLMLVLDTSRSMAEQDALLAEGAGLVRRSRLELAREAVAGFASVRVAEGDRVGLVVFGDSAFTQCPLTHDGALLGSALARAEVGIAGESTALGDALALAVKRTTATGTDAGARVVVLLTDGRSNAGEIPLGIALELAAGAGVRVHTVGVGRGGDDARVGGGEGADVERHLPDHATLQRIARQTGGRFFAAGRSRDLAAVYDEIARLERRPRPLPPRLLERERAEPLLAAAGSLLLLEILLVRLLRRRIP